MNGWIINSFNKKRIREKRAQKRKERQDADL